MKSLKESLLGDMEAAINSKYLYYPKDIDELFTNIRECFENNITDLNCIDTSEITDMNYLFDTNYGIQHKLAGFENYIKKMDISKWNVSKVKNMKSMFEDSKFNGDISNWDVRNVEDMSYMFVNSKFNGDISKWNVSNVKNMIMMFYDSKFNGDISNWDISNVKNMTYMFERSKFNRDISKWDVSNVLFYDDIFNKCKIKEKYKPKFK